LIPLPLAHHFFPMLSGPILSDPREPIAASCFFLSCPNFPAGFSYSFFSCSSLWLLSFHFSLRHRGSVSLQQVSISLAFFPLLFLSLARRVVFHSEIGFPELVLIFCSPRLFFAHHRSFLHILDPQLRDPLVFMTLVMP